MIIVIRLLLLCAVTLSLTATAFAVREDTASSCIRVADYEVDCLGYDNYGRMRYSVSFKFSYVKPGTNFIRIYRDSEAGQVHTYPFKGPRQTVTLSNCGCCDWETVTIDVYDVLPNGKVVKCRIYYDVFLCCEDYYDGKRKDVVAGESISTTPSLTVAPNPASEAVNVTLSIPSYDPASSVDVVDMNGNVVATVAQGMAQGLTTVSAELLDLPAGMYMVRMTHVSGIAVVPLQVIR